MIGAERLNQFKQVAHKILRPLELTAYEVVPAGVNLQYGTMEILP